MCEAAKNILSIVYPVGCLGDFNSFGLLVKIAKIIQQADTQAPKGKRSVWISQSPSLLNGFSFNKYNTFETLVKSPVSISIDRPGGTGLVNIPYLVPGIHLVNPLQQPYYMFVCTLGRLCDLVLSKKGSDYETLKKDSAYCDVQCSPWFNWNEPMPPIELMLQAPGWIDEPHHTLIAGIGIAFGKEVTGGSIEVTKYAGAGKIWEAK